MGLDCTAYRQLRLAEPGEGVDEDGDTLDGYDKFWINKHFPGREGDIKEDLVYKSAEEFRWRAGSYSGYNEWRNELATMAGYVGNAKNCYGTNRPEVVLVGMPFFELVWFSDCEGTLGTATCAKLAKDFAAFQEKADQVSFDDAVWFQDLYAKWRKACEMAADGGAISFH